MNFLNIFSLSADLQTSFWGDIWNYLYDVYLSADGNYENLGFEKMPLISIRLLVLGIFVGSVIACVIMLYNKQIIGNIVRKLISDSCFSPDCAKTVEELGFKKNVLARNALLSDSALRRFVRCVEEDEFYREQDEAKEAYEEKRAALEKSAEPAPTSKEEAPEPAEEGEASADTREEQAAKMPKLSPFKCTKYLIDIGSAHFYLPEELRIKAEIKYEKKGSGWGSAIFAIIALAVIFFAVLLVLPMILGFIDSIL